MQEGGGASSACMQPEHGEQRVSDHGGHAQATESKTADVLRVGRGEEIPQEKEERRKWFEVGEFERERWSPAGVRQSKWEERGRDGRNEGHGRSPGDVVDPNDMVGERGLVVGGGAQPTMCLCLSSSSWQRLGGEGGGYGYRNYV